MTMMTIHSQVGTLILSFGACRLYCEPTAQPRTEYAPGGTSLTRDRTRNERSDRISKCVRRGL